MVGLRTQILTLSAGMILGGCATNRPVGAYLTQREAYAPAIPAATPAFFVASSGSQRMLDVEPRARSTVVDTAKQLVGRSKIFVDGQKYGSDCTALVRAAYSSIGVELLPNAREGSNGVSGIWQFAEQHGRIYQGGLPVKGDLVFFRETYDRNRDGRSNDGLTHVGLVEKVEPDGTVLVIHRVAHGVVRYRMNLNLRNVAVTANGRRVNDWLRHEKPNSKAQLTSQLFAGFATLLPADRQISDSR